MTLWHFCALPEKFPTVGKISTRQYQQEIERKEEEENAAIATARGRKRGIFRGIIPRQEKTRQEEEKSGTFLGRKKKAAYSRNVSQKQIEANEEHSRNFAEAIRTYRKEKELRGTSRKNQQQ